MEKFNKFIFLQNLENEIIFEIQEKNICLFDDIQEYIYQEIDTACIYYSDCFEIVMNLGTTDFGDAKSITELAYYSLREYIYENINMNKLTELL